MATIMVVDDSKTVRSYHGSILKSMGLDVLEAENLSHSSNIETYNNSYRNAKYDNT
jgi:CheY-like chemotaxis protein